MIKGIFTNRSVSFQAGVFVYCLLIGLLLSSVCVMAVIHFFGTISDAPVSDKFVLSFYAHHAVQFFTNLFIFFLPAIATAYLCSFRPMQFLGLQRITNCKMLILTVLMLFCLFPAIELASYFNLKMQLPEFMAPLENWMRTKEETSKQFTDLLLSEKGFVPFIINLLIIGVTASVTEELLFRGALLSLLRKKIKNPHLSIWLVAVLFSAIHLQFYGFIPRLLLGAFLGYLLIWSRTVWLPMLAHFINNAIVLTAYKTDISPDSSINSTFIPPDTTPQAFIIIVLLAVIGLVLFFICARQMKLRGCQ